MMSVCRRILTILRWGIFLEKQEVLSSSLLTFSTLAQFLRTCAWMSTIVRFVKKNEKIEMNSYPVSKQSWTNDSGQNIAFVCFRTRGKYPRTSVLCSGALQLTKQGRVRKLLLAPHCPLLINNITESFPSEYDVVSDSVHKACPLC